MIKIPDNVEDWDIGLIAKLIHEGYDENEILEFKSEINEQTKKIPITACAFANTRGGIIVLGVNNDRTNALSLDQKLVGLVDSDDLKSKITNQLKNIQPDILLSNIQFKESNIKLLNGRVIVVVKILKSKNAPHQFEYKFYKRLSNANEPMSVEEIRRSILESEKTEILLNLFLSEGGYLREEIKYIKNQVEKNDLTSAFNSCDQFDIATCENFLYTQSYLYGSDVAHSILWMIEDVKKLISFHNSFYDPFVKRLEVFSKVCSDMNLTPQEFVKRDITLYADSILQHLENIEELLKKKFLDPEIFTDPRQRIRKLNPPHKS